MAVSSHFSQAFLPEPKGDFYGAKPLWPVKGKSSLPAAFSCQILFHAGTTDHGVYIQSLSSLLQIKMRPGRSVYTLSN